MRINYKIFYIIWFLSVLIFLLNCFQRLDEQDFESDNWKSLYKIRFEEIQMDSIKQDSLDKICERRGHMIMAYGVTSMYWSPYYVDLENKTLLISHNPNYKRGKCRRCKRIITEPVQAEPDTVIIWKKLNE